MENANKPAKKKSSFTRYHIIVSVLTFFAYAIIHANRKSFSNVKVLVTEEWTPASYNATIQRQKEPAEIWSKHNFFPSSNDTTCKTFLGILDTIFMVVYAIALYIGGILGDRFNLRYLLSISLIGTSAMVICFMCVSEWIGLYSIPWYITFWIFNGLFQGPVWPCCLAVMGNWFGQSNRGLIFGIWSSNASVGNIIGSFIVAAYVDYGYEMAVLVPAVIQVGFAIVLFFGLVVSPSEVGITLDDDVDTEGTMKQVGTCETVVFEEQQQPGKNNGAEVVKAKFEIAESPKKQDEKSSTKPVSFVEALCLPGVIIYALSYSCLKLVNYAFFFWLPFYMNRQFHWSQADSDSLSIWYDVGGIIGGIVIGLISDRLNRPVVLLVNLLIGLPTIIVYNFIPGDKILNACILFLIGFFISGVANILSSAVAADLGRHPTLSSSKSALATVSGIIDGTGSAGAALGQIAIPLIEEALGWASVFWMLLGCCCLTCIGVGRMVYSELTRWSRFRNACPCYNDDNDDEKGTNIETSSL